MISLHENYFKRASVDNSFSTLPSLQKCLQIGSSFQGLWSTCSHTPGAPVPSLDSCVAIVLNGASVAHPLKGVIT